MRYTVFSVSQERAQFRQAIIDRCPLDYAPVKSVNGVTEDLDSYIERWGLSESIKNNHQPYHKGELGIWFSVLNAIEWCASNEEELLTLEDDAMIQTDFGAKLESRLSYLPSDYDFLSLFVPRDHTDWFHYEKLIDERGVILDGKHKRVGRNNVHPYFVNQFISKSWQRYGGVSMLYSPSGARKILDLISTIGISWQYDEWMYMQQRIGNLNGYSFNPGKVDIVRLRPAKSTVHYTEMYNANT